MPKKRNVSARKSAPRSGAARSKRKTRNRRRNLLIASGVFFIIMLASVLVAVFAAPQRQSMDRFEYSLADFKAKGYGKTTIASLANSADTPLDTGDSCRTAWQKQSKMNASYNYFCWRNSDTANGWKPQGITGSGSAQTGADGGNNSLLLVSWYSEGKPSLVAPTQTEAGANSAARLTVVNMKTKKYRHVELVKSCAKAANKLCKINSHAGGIAWAGQYLYVASTTSIYVFNIADMRMVDGRPVLPTSERLTLNQSNARVSTISFDSAANQLVTSEYRDPTSKSDTQIARWNLTENHQFTTKKTVAAATTLAINAVAIQGIASHKGTYIAQSSSETVPGRTGRGGTLLKWRSASSMTRYRMPYHVESAYVDTTNKRIWSLTEPGDHANESFVFSFPSDGIF